MNIIKKTTELFLHLDEKDDGIISQLMFFIPFGIWLAIKILQKTYVFDTLGLSFSFTRLRIALLAIIVARELLFGRWNRRSFAGLVTFTLMACIAYNAHWSHLVDGAVFIFAARNIPLRKLIWFFVFEVGTLTTIVVICSLVDALPHRMVSGTPPRHSLGFTWVNTPASLYFFLICAWVFLRNDRFSLAEAVLALIIAGFIFWHTRSRAAFFASIILIILVFLFSRIGNKIGGGRLFRAVCISSIAVIAITAVLFSYFFDPSIPWMARINGSLTGRFALAHSNMMEDGIKFFGQHVSFGSVTNNIADLVDCLYPKLLIHAGVLFFIISITLCTLQCKRSVDAECWCMVAIFIAIALHAISEPFAAYLFFNPFLFLLGEFFGDRKNGPPEPKSSKAR